MSSMHGMTRMAEPASRREPAVQHSKAGAPLPSLWERVSGFVR
jgi:hypothetical protein